MEELEDGKNTSGCVLKQYLWPKLPETPKFMSVLTLGTVAFDTIETPYGNSGKVVGGAASYIALAASLFAPKQDLVSVIGNDFPEDFLAELRKRGAGLEGLTRVPDGKSFHWAGSYHNDMVGRDTLATDLNVLIGWDPAVCERGSGAEFVVLGNLDPEVQGRVLDQVSSPKLVVLDTMNFWMDVALENLKKIVSRADVLTVNDEEARQLTGEHFLPKAAKAIHAMGPSTVVIKKGEHGALMFQGGQTFFAPAYPLEHVVDPTGAGDTFAGGFVGYLSARHAATGNISWEDMKQAVTAGSVMASFTCEAFGTDGLRALTVEDMKARWNEYRDLTACGELVWP
jgi:sugar/nucleoside kinase (ribokinase family)